MNFDQSQAAESDGQWPMPQPLTAKIAPEPYPMDALPRIVREAVEEVAAFVKAPILLVACLPWARYRWCCKLMLT